MPSEQIDPSEDIYRVMKFGQKRTQISFLNIACAICKEVVLPKTCALLGLEKQGNKLWLPMVGNAVWIFVFCHSLGKRVFQESN